MASAGVIRARLDKFVLININIRWFQPVEHISSSLQIMLMDFKVFVLSILLNTVTNFFDLVWARLTFNQTSTSRNSDNDAGAASPARVPGLVKHTLPLYVIVNDDRSFGQKEGSTNEAV